MNASQLHIQNNYLLIPDDIYPRTVKAAGGQVRYITPAINALRNYLFIQLLNLRKRNESYICRINSDHLYDLLKLGEYLKQGRKQLAKKAKDKAVQTCINLGLILRAEEVIGAKNQLMHVFTLNKDFS